MLKIYRRITPTVARELTQADYEELGGVIVSREGPKEFEVGDYMGRDAVGVWKIKRAVLKEKYHPVGKPDEEGWTEFQSNTPYCRATKMDKAFEVNGLQGQVGDYLVTDLDGNHARPVAPEIFEASRVEVTVSPELADFFEWFDKHSGDIHDAL